MCSIWIYFIPCGHDDTEYHHTDLGCTRGPSCENQYAIKRNVPCHDCIRTRRWRIIDTAHGRYAIEKGNEMLPVRIS